MEEVAEVTEVASWSWHLTVHLAPGTWYLVLGTCCPESGTGYFTLGTWYLLPKIWHLVLCTWNLVFGLYFLRNLAQGTWYLVLVTLDPKSGT